MEAGPMQVTITLEIANGRPRRTSAEPGYGDCRDFARHIAVAHAGDTAGGRLGKSSHILRGPGFCQRGFRI